MQRIFRSKKQFKDRGEINNKQLNKVNLRIRRARVPMKLNVFATIPVDGYKFVSALSFLRLLLKFSTI
jgi:hypothetical protein